MVTFDYQVVELSDKALRGKHASETLQDAINADARKGWRLVQVLPARLFTAVNALG